jgi:hydroxymethylpyrimidine/phosphomethylpyrimidine kinase
MKKNIPIVLCIAGSDSGGGAGIQADIKTLNTLRVFATTAITCITAQNTQEVISIKRQQPNIVSDQIKAVLKDFKVSSIKIGMLYDKAIMKTVTKSLKKFKHIPIILDPVMISKSGDYLLKSDSINFFVKNILPGSFLVTPNLHEASIITNMKKIKTKKDIEECFNKFTKLGASNVLIKGGHSEDKNKSIDYLSFNNKIYTISGKRYTTSNTHGTGCTLSAAISGNIALGMNLLDATKNAKRFINMAIKNSFNIGKGYGPLNHFT